MSRTATRNLALLIVALAILAGVLRQSLNNNSSVLRNINNPQIMDEDAGTPEVTDYENKNVGIKFKHPADLVVEPISTRQNYYINLIPEDIYEAQQQGQGRFVNEYVIGFTFYRNRENLSIDRWVDNFIEENRLEVSQLRNENVSGKEAVSFVIANEDIDISGDKVYVFEHTESGDIVFFYHLDERIIEEAANIVLDSIEFETPETGQD